MGGVFNAPNTLGMLRGAPADLFAEIPTIQHIKQAILAGAEKQLGPGRQDRTRRAQILVSIIVIRKSDAVGVAERNEPVDQLKRFRAVLGPVIGELDEGFREVGRAVEILCDTTGVVDRIPAIPCHRIDIPGRIGGEPR